MPDERAGTGAAGGVGVAGDVDAGLASRSPDDAGRALLGLADEPARLMVAVQGRRGIDVAEAIDALETSEAAQVMAALSLPMAVAVLDSGVLHDAAGILARITDRWAGQLLEGMAPMRRAQLFRQVQPAEDARLRAALSPSARLSLDAILAGASRASDAASQEAQEAIARARRRRRQRRLRRALLVIALLVVAAVVMLSVAAVAGAQGAGR